MPVSFSGGCACGAIRYECSAAPLISGNCHCRQCQQTTGGAYLPCAIVPTAAFALTAGAVKYHTMKADNGYVKRYGFCETCGSVVTATTERDTDIIVLAAGSFDDPSWFQPTHDMYTGEAHPWDHMDPALEKFEADPPE